MSDESIDVAPGKAWSECTLEQKVNRIVGALYQMSMQLEFFQETLMTHDHQKPLVNIKKEEKKDE